MKLHEHGIKVEERVPERRLHRILVVNEMQIGFMSGKGTMGSVSTFKRLQKENHVKSKS